MTVITTQVTQYAMTTLLRFLPLGMHACHGTYDHRNRKRCFKLTLDVSGNHPTVQCPESSVCIRRCGSIGRPNICSRRNERCNAMPKWKFCFLWCTHLSSPPIASDQQRPASGQTELLKYWAMVSGNIIDDLGEIKGVRCG